MKLLIAVPTFETIRPETFRSIYNLKNVTPITPTFDFIKGYDCAKARNEIAKKALEENFDFVLMIDSDIIVPENTIECLLEKPVDICLGVYPRKNTKFQETELFKFDSSDFVTRFNYSEMRKNSTDRIRVKGGGLGCTMIKTDVFKKLKFPWFKFLVYDNGSVLSEDLFFCNEANKLKLVIEADRRVECGHLAQYFQYD